MLSRYNAVEVELALRAISPPPPFPPASDRKAWRGVADMIGEQEVSRLIKAGEVAAQEVIPPLPATLFLEFQRTGRREGYQQPRQQRRHMLSSLVLAECLAYEGRFLDPILDLVWAICEESSWVLPAHQSRLTDLDVPVVDLGSASTALELAEVDLLLGAELDPLLGKRIRDEVNQRILTPYLQRHDHWWLYNTSRRQVNNWTAVCNAGVVGAALYLEQDMGRLAEIIARAARSLDDYLATFDVDGGSSEGPGYWGYGFGYYTVLAHLIEQRTDGHLNFLAGERMRKIAAYPLHTILSPGTYVNFSDCDANITYSRAHLAFLARRLDLPDLAGLAQTQPAEERRTDLTWRLRTLFWRLPPEAPHSFTPTHHDWFSGMMWMLARYNPQDPNTLVLAAKGGHNQEMHNQNDVGNFIVHVDGESVITDVGRGRYTKAYFGPERYEYFVNSSLGHSVPVPNGQLQGVGRDYAAGLLDYRVDEAEDTLYLELKDVYPPEAGLDFLRRRLTLHREAPRGWVELVDSVRFTAGLASFESALTTFGQVDVGSNAVILTGTRGKLRIGFDPELVEVRADLYKDVDLGLGPTDVRRVVFAWQEPRQVGQIRLEIVPI